MARVTVSCMLSILLGLLISLVIVPWLQKHIAEVTVTEPPRPDHYEYAAPFSDRVVGKTFKVESSVLDAINFPIPQSQMVSLTSSSVKEFVVVTAASGGFFRGVINTLLTVRKYFPDNDIIVYDLGLTNDQVTQLSSACRVRVKEFHFEKYPEHVKNMNTYAWKPLVIHDVLQQHHGVLWLDSTGRVLSSDMSTLWEQILTKTHGALMACYTGHSNYAVTHPQMYQYIPSNTSELKRTRQWETNGLYLYRTRHVYNNVIKWWVLCALDKDCIAPTNNRFCHFPKDDRFNTYANCHRFDQSAINVLLANLYGFEDSLYYAKDRLFRTSRNGQAEDGELEKC